MFDNNLLLNVIHEVLGAIETEWGRGKYFSIEQALGLGEQAFWDAVNRYGILSTTNHALGEIRQRSQGIKDAVVWATTNDLRNALRHTSLPPGIRDTIVERVRQGLEKTLDGIVLVEAGIFG